MHHGRDLLERDREIEALAAAVRAATERTGTFAAVRGAAGLGKTRMLAEFGRLAAAAGFDVHTARGSELEGELPFGLVRQLFEAGLVRMDPAERAELLSGAAAEASSVLLGSGGQAGDFAVLHGLYWFTANLAERRPVALVLDDLHWADVASLRYLAYLLPRLAGLPVALVVATRPDGSGAVDRITTDPLCTLLRPAPLSEQAAGTLLAGVLTGPVDPAFRHACQTAAGGNPLLLRELAATFEAEGVRPSAANAALVDVLGPRAVAGRVALWADRLPAECLRLARAVAVLGDGAAPREAAALAGLAAEDAARAAVALERADLFRRESAAGRADGALRFGHPLVRAAVYDLIDPGERIGAHRAAAQLLRDNGMPAEQVATHLLRVPPAGDPAVVEVLRRAARDAFAHGSPDVAVTHLRRCLAEPPAPAERPDVLWELGRMATLVDTAAAVTDLAAALECAPDPRRRAEIALTLGTGQFYLALFDDAERTWLDALTALPTVETDLRRRLEAAVLMIPLLQPGRMRIAARAPALAALPPHPSFGGRALDCVLAGHDAWHNEPRSVARALRGLGDGVLVGTVSEDTPAVLCGWLVLLLADREEALASIDGAVARAHQGGSVRGLATAHAIRGLAWLWRGDLAEAETALREAMREVHSARVELGPLVPGCFLADVLVEQGRLDEAQAALDTLGIPEPAPLIGPLYWYLDSRTRLLRQQGRLAEALRAALATGDRYARHDGDNPAYLSWRTEAALCAHALGDPELAAAHAGTDLAMARHWGAPRALGRSLRVSGLIGGDTGLLRESVAVLRPSPARLELAKSLVALGSALREAGEHGPARDALGEGLDLAELCGAAPLLERARGALRATGVRPRRGMLTGPVALTPSERRVAELAVEGHANRAIAERLYITVKTVEVHLTSCYRKLGITSREALAAALGS